MRKRILLLVKILVSGGLILWLYSRVNLGEILSVFSTVKPGLILLILLLFFLNTLLSSIKWRILLHADGIEVPLRTLLMSYLVGTFFNLFLPSNIGGDAYRIYDIGKYSARTANTFASVFADRLSGFVALVVLGLAATCGAYRVLPDKTLILVVLLVFVAILFALWAITHERLLRWGMRITRVDRIGALVRFFDKFMGSIRVYRTHPGLLGKVLGISFCFQFTAIFCIWLIARALHIDASLLLFFAFVPIISLLEALPISVYGLGIRDGSYVFFFGHAGVGEPEALAMALLYVGLTLVYALTGGVIFMIRTRAAKA